MSFSKLDERIPTFPRPEWGWWDTVRTSSTGCAPRGGWALAYYPKRGRYPYSAAGGRSLEVRQHVPSICSRLFLRESCPYGRSSQVSLGGETLARRSPAAQPRALRILLIEDDPVDAAWLTELINEKCPTSEVVHGASLPDALSALAQRSIDTVFVAVHPDGEGGSIEGTREIVRRADVDRSWPSSTPTRCRTLPRFGRLA
jgi:hypothetical protein